MACLDQTVARTTRPMTNLLLLLASVVASWWIYVPVHELLHAAGCAASGGEVRSLTISASYGGGILSRWLPWVHAGGEYAGRLTDFSTGRSDLRYLATDAAPYLLTVLLGVPLLRLASRRGSPLMAGAALVLALAPFLSVTGDYYEMGSILVTRAASPFDSPPEPSETPGGVMGLRSDDLPALLGRLLGGGLPPVADPPGGATGAIGVIAMAFLTGLGLAEITYSTGSLVARRLFRDS